jgi:glycosyltransferase involved in cell wall biosynthesis
LNKAPRILHITTSFPADDNDVAAPFVYKLVETQQKMGCNTSVLTPATKVASSFSSKMVHRFRYAPSRWQSLAQSPGGIPVALARQPLYFMLVPGFLAAMALSLIRKAKQSDIIHAHWSICGAIAVFTQQFHHKPVITTLRGADQHAGQKLPYSWIHRKAIEGSAFIVTVNKAFAREVGLNYPHIKRSIRVIPNGVAGHFYMINDELRTKTPSLKMLFIGSLIPRKGCEIALKALSELSNEKEISLTIVGDGPERSNLQHLSLTMGIDDKVHFTGSIPPQEIVKFIEQHHLLLLPSYHEGRPNVVLEAMASGLPVVASDIEGNRELIREGNSGWLFPPGNYLKLADILLSILQGKKNLQAAGREGRCWMKDNGFTWEKTVARYIDLYQSILHGREKD